MVEIKVKMNNKMCEREGKKHEIRNQSERRR